LEGPYIALKRNYPGALLCGADLAEANLAKADLAKANLVDANLVDANLRGAYLYQASLTVSWEELERHAKSLEGATIPNGQKYEEWLKSKDRESDGENGGSS
jgi:uncharacterized protein YjbI with pentapeptide repeats